MPVGIFMPVVLNGVPLFGEPGFSSRMASYFTTNVAQTAVQHDFPELRIRTFDATNAEMFQYSLEVAEALSWEIESKELDNNLKLVVSSALWGFKDDVEIRLEQLGSRQTKMHLTSRSRTGKADFGANLAHILDFYEVLESRMGSENPAGS